MGVLPEGQTKVKTGILKVKIANREKATWYIENKNLY